MCRFSEVKGPGDVLSETQKVWIDVLLSAGVDVELCSVKEIIEEDEMRLSDDDGDKASRKRVRASASALAASPAKKRKQSASMSASVEPSMCSRAKTRDETDEPPTEEKENLRSERAPRKRVKKGSESVEPSGGKAKKASATSGSGKVIGGKKGKAGKKKVKASVASNEVIVLSD